MNVLLPLLLSGIVLPAAVAGAVFLLLRKLWPQSPAVSAAFAVGCGYVAGQLGVRGWRGWIPRESTDWFVVVALAGMLVGASGLARRGPTALHAPLRLALAGGALWQVLGRILARQYEGVALVQALALPAAALAVAWAAVDALAAPRARAGPLALLLVVVIGGAGVLLLSGSALLGQLAGALAAALTAVLLLSRGVAPAELEPVPVGKELLAGAAPVLLLTLGTQLARMTLEVSAGPAAARAALLLAAAPLAAWGVRLFAAQRARGEAAAPARVFAAQLAAVLLLVGGAIAVAVAGSPPAEASGY